MAFPAIVDEHRPAACRSARVAIAVISGVVGSYNASVLLVKLLLQPAWRTPAAGKTKQG